MQMRFSVLIALVIVGFSPVLLCAAEPEAMPAEQVNALVKKYCTSCHSDKLMVGGFSLEKFHQRTPDPGLAAMLVAKIKDGALGADGTPVPDRPTIKALVGAMTAEAAGSDQWVVTTQPGGLAASVVTESAPNLFRLSLTCRSETREGEMRVTWSPGDVPKGGGSMSASIDGKAPHVYPVPYYTGHAILPQTTLPEATLTVANLLPGTPAVFSFDRLPASARKELGACFNSSGR